MKFGTFFAYWEHDWKGDFKYYAKKVASLGFDALEVSAAMLLDMSDNEIDELRECAKSEGIILTSNLGPAKKYDVSSKDPAVRENGIRFITDILKKMERLDSHSLIGVIYAYWPCDFTDLDKQGAWERSVESVRRLSSIAGDLGILYCLEVVNRFESNLLNTAEEAVRYCKDVDTPACRILLDTFHMNIEEDNLGDAIRTAGSYLGHLHVGEANRKVPGKGHLPWNEIGQALRDIGYDGNVIMEPFVTEGGQIGKDIKVWRDLSDHADEAKLDRDIAESLIFLRKAFLG